MPTGPKVFLAMPDACGLQPCDRTHLKKPLCHISLVVGRMINTVAFESWRRTTRDELECRTAGEDCWGRKRNIRTAAEAHQHTRLYMKDYTKLGMKTIDICETLRRIWFHVFFLLLRSHTIPNRIWCQLLAHVFPLFPPHTSWIV